MRAVIQKVTSASVSIDGVIVSQIEKGLLVLLGIKMGDTQVKRDYFVKKIINLRIFEDDVHKMNKRVVDVDGEILVVSQFTLYGDCRKGNRPSFIQAMPPAEAKHVYNDFVKILKEVYPKVKEGVFGAYMQVNLINDGPVTIFLDD